MSLKQGINVRYIYSACIVTTTPDVSVLHDPWFSEGIYDGSWFHFPKVENPINLIGDVDLIYISHIHPDHYDAKFLHQYFEVYGEKKVVIANHKPNYLVKKMQADGIKATILEEPLVIGDTSIEIFPHQTGSLSDIDSAVIIKYESQEKLHCIVNANDIIFDEPMRTQLKEKAGEVDILLCGYTGAGSYPQTYFDLRDEKIEKEAEKKKNSFFERYKTLVHVIDANVNIPFAGKYILGGKLIHLNHYRGISDPLDVTEFDPNALILKDQGGEINTFDLKPNGVRKERYLPENLESRLKEISENKMAYEKLIAFDEIHQLPLKRLLAMAAKNARLKSECHEDYFFCIHLPSEEFFVVNANSGGSEKVMYVSDRKELPTPRSELFIDPRYLFGLLTHIYHWNNAEIGSQYMTRRTPNEFNRKAQSFLNFFVV